MKNKIIERFIAICHTRSVEKLREIFLFRVISRAVLLLLAVSIFIVVPIGFGESFPNRPTETEMGDLVTLGTESGHGVYERCYATQYSTNPAYYVSPPTFIGTNGWYLSTSVMQTLDDKAKALVSYYANPDTVYDGTTNIVMLTVTSLWAQLEIGDHTNQFTGTPAIGTNPPTYGDYPWRPYTNSLEERYKVLNALKLSLVAVSVSNMMHFGTPGITPQFPNYNAIVEAWPSLSWGPSSIYPGAYIDTYLTGPWTCGKIRGQFYFKAPLCTSVICNVQLYGHTAMFTQGSINEFLSFEAPSGENEYFRMDYFLSPTPGQYYSDSTFWGDSTAIVPDPGSEPLDWTKGWTMTSIGIIDWQFQYCTNKYW